MKVEIKIETKRNARYLSVDAGVRRWYSSQVNGVADTNPDVTGDQPRMPCVFPSDANEDGVPASQIFRFRPMIDLDKGEILNWIKGTVGNIMYVVRDNFRCYLLDEKRNLIASYEGVTPRLLCTRDDLAGDYIFIDVNENGFILDWDKERINEIEGWRI